MTTSLYYEDATRIDAQEAFRQIRLGDSWRLVRLGARDSFSVTLMGTFSSMPRSSNSKALCDCQAISRRHVCCRNRQDDTIT